METFLGQDFIKITEKNTTEPAATKNAGKGFAEGLEKGSVTGVMGGLGAGKTLFISGAGEKLGAAKQEVVSPTFNYVREYEGSGCRIYHFDFYRISSYEELEKIGYRDNYLADRDGIVIIEWPENVKEIFPDLDRLVVIEHKGGDKRKIKFYEPG